MINKREVCRLKIPFPNIESGLAIKAHMQICIDPVKNQFLTCQTARPHLAKPGRPPFNYVIEIPDLERTPFQHPTLIDCDKSFELSEQVEVLARAKTALRPDICEELFLTLLHKINHDKFRIIKIQLDELETLNPAYIKRTASRS